MLVPPRKLLHALGRLRTQVHPSRHERSDGAVLRTAVSTLVLSALTLVLLLAGANLRLRWLLHQRASETGLTLKWAAAYTVFPGVVEVRELEVSSRSPALLRVLAPRARMRLGLTDLALGRLDLHAVHVDGLTLEVTGIAQDDVTPPAPERDLTALGIAGPTLLNERARSRIRIDALDAAVASLRIGDYAFSGKLRIRGEGLELSPTAPATLALTLELDGASVQKGHRELLGQLHGEVKLNRTSILARSGVVSPFEVEPREAQTSATFRLSGADVSQLFAFAGVPDSLYALFQPVSQRPFKLEAHVLDRPGAFFVRDFRAESGAFRAVGAFRDTHADRAGAFLLTLSERSAGILVGAREANFLVGADSAWLARSQELLGLW
jgi:hypothetical protein